MSKRIALFPALLLALLVIVATALTWMNFSQALPRSQWAQAAWSPDIDIIEQMIFHYSLLPRLAISLLVGAGLGLVGVLFQQVLRNPLAEPTTLGVATGAQLGITVTTLWAIPGAMASQFAALAGACVVGLIVFGVAWGKRLSPVTLILAGLVVSLYCGAINQLLVIFHHDQLQSMFLWSTGTLTQTDWGGVERLWPQLLGGVMLTLLLLRPLTLMGLDDGVARNLGLALSLARLAALSLAIVISALLVNAVGIIGFIGLFAPLLAKMLGARRLLPRLMLASLIGALILWLSDQIILWLTRVWMEVSTGSVTALIGAPLLLWLLPRLRSISAPDMKVNDRVAAERQHVLAFALAGGVLLLMAVVVALQDQIFHTYNRQTFAYIVQNFPYATNMILIRMGNINSIQSGRTPQGVRGLKPVAWLQWDDAQARRTPQGVRGLKPSLTAQDCPQKRSHSARSAWIETLVISTSPDG